MERTSAQRDPVSKDEYRVPADLTVLGDVRRLVDEAAQRIGFDSGDRYALKLAASEAVANAVEHGTCDGADQILLRFEEAKNSLVVEVADEGYFGPAATRIEFVERGRGLAVTFELMDVVHIQLGESGTVIRFAKRRGGRSD